MTIYFNLLNTFELSVIASCDDIRKLWPIEIQKKKVCRPYIRSDLRK